MRFRAPASRTTRRAVAAIAVAGLALAACGGDDDSGGGATPADTTAAEPDGDGDDGGDGGDGDGGDLAGQTLVISNWDAYTPEGLIPSFEEATGVSVNLTTHATNEEIVAKLIQSGGTGYDVAFVSAQFAEQLNEAGLLLEIDRDLIPNMSFLAPEALELATDPGLTFSVPYTWGTTGLCYREDLVPAAPTSWNDLLDPAPENVGKVTMLQTDRWLLLPAQKALGFSANTTDDAELAEVTELLKSAKDTLLAYDDTTFYSRLVSGEASLVQAWDGWCNYAIAENADVKFVIPSEGSDLWSDTMVILKSSQSPEAAHAFINHVLEPANHAQVAELVLYKVPNPEAMALVDPELLELFPNLGMTPEELLQGEELVDLGDDTVKYTDIVTEVTAS
jgi:spermidine/putrescine transport system substrate-binding protein